MASASAAQPQVLEEITIGEVAAGGSGVGRLASGKVCFVPCTLPGERVEVEVVAGKSRHAIARLVRVVEASPRRVTPRCAVFGRCGGCQLQHAEYSLQLEIKHSQVVGALAHIGRIEAPVVGETVPSPDPFGYRNRITVHAAGGAIGFFAAGSREVVDVARCPIASEELNVALEALRARKPADGSHSLREPGPYRGFRQVNAAAAALLVGLVREWARPTGGGLIDAYCGGGLFGLALAQRFGRVIGIEWSPDAVRHAREQAPSHAEFIEGDVGDRLPAALASAPKPTVLILDPPAAGLTGEVVAAIKASPPDTLLYVSCDPATLARDIARLGMAFVRAVPVDMFPQTAAIECVAELRPASQGA